MSSLRLPARMLALACGLVPSLHLAFAAPADYRFALVGKPAASGGSDIVHVQLIHIPDGKPIAGAVIFDSTADMGPEGMATMTGPVRAMPPQGTDYAFEIAPGMSGNWALHLSAKVQGEAGTVTGTLTAALVK